MHISDHVFPLIERTYGVEVGDGMMWVNMEAMGEEVFSSGTLFRSVHRIFMNFEKQGNFLSCGYYAILGTFHGTRRLPR